MTLRSEEPDLGSGVSRYSGRSTFRVSISSFRCTLAALTVACALAAVLGFAAHRASVCSVRAVAEMLSSRTAYALAAIAKSGLWAFAIIGAALSFMPSAGAQLGGWPLSGTAAVGGFLFGIGAAINGACAFSTLARLADGEGRMLATAAAFMIGVLCYAILVDLHWLERPVPGLALVGAHSEWALAPVLLLPFGVYEARRLWRTRAPTAHFFAFVLAPQYRLSSAAMLIGMTSAAVILISGSASYTVTIQQVVEALRGMGDFPAVGRWLLLSAMIGGMLLSTIQRGSFRLDLTPRWRWLRNAMGGLLMGVGTAVTPGGNDTLVLYGIPTLSPHALPTFIAMLLGIGLGLLVMRTLFGVEMRVACRNDLYFVDSSARTATKLSLEAPSR